MVRCERKKNMLRRVGLTEAVGELISNAVRDAVINPDYVAVSSRVSVCVYLSHEGLLPRR